MPGKAELNPTREWKLAPNGYKLSEIYPPSSQPVYRLVQTLEPDILPKTSE